MGVSVQVWVVIKQQFSSQEKLTRHLVGHMRIRAHEAQCKASKENTENPSLDDNRFQNREIFPSILTIRQETLIKYGNNNKNRLHSIYRNCLTLYMYQSKDCVCGSCVTLCCHNSHQKQSEFFDYICTEPAPIYHPILRSDSCNQILLLQ